MISPFLRPLYFFDKRYFYIFRFDKKNRQRGDSKKELRSAETDIWLGGNLTLKDTFNRTTTVSRPYPKINRGLLRKNGSKVHFLEKMPLKIRYLTVIMGMFHKPLSIFVRQHSPGHGYDQGNPGRRPDESKTDLFLWKIAYLK